MTIDQTSHIPADPRQGDIRVPVDLGPRSYDILVAPGLLGRAGRLMAPLMATRRAVVVTDTTVASHHGETLERSLSNAGITSHQMAVPPGETSKSTAAFTALLDQLLGMRLDRGVTIIALGGGVIGDLAGFAAAVTLRGLPFVQIPTTLLAQVDSSVGGKTGINSPHGKNLIGAFYQPKLVLADLETLETLPDRQRRAGYAEVVKYGLIDDPAFFEWLYTAGGQVLAGDPEAMARAVATSCRSKARIVAADERESGQRALLNFGHTFAHALETETGYGDRLLHGEAVAIGMVLAHRLSERLGVCGPEPGDTVVRHLHDLGLPTEVRAATGLRVDCVDTLLGHMAKDKKTRDGRLTFILTRGIGKAFVAHDVPADPVRAVLAEALAA